MLASQGGCRLFTKPAISFLFNKPTALLQIVKVTSEIPTAKDNNQQPTTNNQHNSQIRLQSPYFHTL
jgi:hypothetical protein